MTGPTDEARLRRQAARRWLEHALTGRISPLEAIAAAARLLDLADQHENPPTSPSPPTR